MKSFFSNFALVDVGSSKVALVVPILRGGTNAAARSVTTRCCIVEPVLTKKFSSSSEIARAEALRRARKRAETMLRTRLRRVFLLANEPSLKLVPPSQERHYKKSDLKSGLPSEPHTPDRLEDEPKVRQERRQQERRQQERSPQEMIVVNAVATDRNKRPLSFYAMDKRRWQFYTRLASYAGVSVVGFVSPAVALGQSLLVHRRALAAVGEGTKARTKAGTGEEAGEEAGVEAGVKAGAEARANKQSFVVIDIGSHTTGVAVFAAGVPCACQSWEFGTASIITALAESLALTPARAATLQRNLVFSESFLNNLFAPSSHSASLALSERRFPRGDTFSKKTGQASPLGATTQAASQQGAVRVVASAYGSLFAEVARFLERCAPQIARNAPVYTTGGGSLVAGSHVLASHLLARCVFPYPRAFGEKTAASGALACLSILSRGGILMPAPTTLSSMSTWSRRLKIFSSREDTRDSFPPQQEDTSHA